jgi:hypothetical protein
MTEGEKTHEEPPPTTTTNETTTREKRRRDDVRQIQSEGPRKNDKERETKKRNRMTRGKDALGWVSMSLPR